MSKIVVFEHLTLDGVMQAPGRPDEDRRGGFAHGGWARPRGDAVMGSAAGESMAKVGALLLGRRTYEDFYAYWPNQPEPNPFTAVLNNSQKYVASTTLQEPLPWRNSTVYDSTRPRRPCGLLYESELPVVALAVTHTGMWRPLRRALASSET